MQTSGQFGVPPSDVSPHYNSVNNSMNNNNSNTGNRSTSTLGSNQALGHMLFNFSTSHDQHAPLSSPAAHNPHPTHGQSAPPPPSVLLGKVGAAELGQETPSLPPQQQQQQNPRFSQFLQATIAAAEHSQGSENVSQEQQKQGNNNMGAAQTRAQAAAPTGDQAQHTQSQSMQLHGQVGEGGGHNEQISADPISMGDIDQAEEGACAGNRWPRQETLALLKIRADMDAAFRDTSVKRPLWDEVSRKLKELGYDRSAKKCKEKFENVNKYYKRTKEGKVGRQDGKNYRFFTQLEALSNNNNNNNNKISNDSTQHNVNHNSISNLTPATMLISNSITAASDSISKFKASASDPPLLPPPPLSASPLDLPDRCVAATPLMFAHSASAATAPLPPAVPLLQPPPFPENATATLPLSSPSSSSDDDDEDDSGDDEDVDDDADDTHADDDYDNPRNHSDHPGHTGTKKRKRKTSTSMMAFFERLVKMVIEKQEQMQQKFLQALEKRETDRMIREEAWMRQEMARLNKEHELRAQERSSAAARDAALIAFLQRATGQTIDLPTTPSTSTMPIVAQPVQCAPPLHQENLTQQYEEHDPSDPNSKRWLKPEVHALIDLHSSLQAKFTEAGPKGHLWEEIADGMAKLGYSSRTAKRCKEKWENINKYFKRAKESNKKRPENAKTCPYFHELDALYRKGLLGSSHANQLSYKPSFEHVQHHVDDDSVAHQPSSTSNDTGDGTDGTDVDHPQNTPTISHRPPDGAGGIATTTRNASGIGGNDANNHSMGDVGMRNVSDSRGVQNKGLSMQFSMDASCVAPASRALEHSASRSGFTAELVLNPQQQSASMDTNQQKQMNQGEQESKPSVLASLPNSSSFMSTILQKINSNSNQEQQCVTQERRCGM